MLRVLALLALLGLQNGLVTATRDCYGAVVELQVNISSTGTSLHLYGYPSAFGAPVNATSSPPSRLVFVQPEHACVSVEPAPQPGAVGLAVRGNCSFSDKAQHLQAAGFGAFVLVDTTDDCTFMFANRSAAAGLTVAATTITADAGALLRQVLAAASGEATASLRQPPLGKVDWSSAVLWAMASSTVLAAAVWAGHDVLDARFGGAASRKGIEQRAEETVHITSGGAAWFVVVASAFLLALFFLMSKWVALLFVVLFALGAWQATASLLLAMLARTCPPAWQAVYCPPLPLVGALPALSMGASLASGAAALTWVLCRHQLWAWVLQDILAICLMLVILRQLLLPNFKVAAILLPMAFVYDVFWVFIQPALTGGDSVMVEVATGGESHEQLPMVLRVPHWPALGTNPAFSILGFGDVVLPGLLAVFTRRFDIFAGLGWAAGYCAPCLGGYGAGLGLTYLALIFSWFGDQGQPALLYLVPCTLGTVAALAWRRGHLGALWSCDLEPRDHSPVAAGLEEGAEERRGLLQS